MGAKWPSGPTALKCAIAQTFVRARAAVQTVRAIGGHRSAQGCRQGFPSRWAISRTTASCPNGTRRSARRSACRSGCGRPGTLMPGGPAAFTQAAKASLASRV